MILVACVKAKLPRPAAARELYTSALFLRERAYAEHSGLPWFILSAEHGLVAPDEWLSPYERTLASLPAASRLAWGLWVVARLDLLAGPLAGQTIEVHAGQGYIAPIKEPLETAGASLLEPLKGLRIGNRLAWYTSRSGDAGFRHSGTDVDGLVAKLSDDRQAVKADVLMASDGAGLRVPGLYSWWVDRPGSRALTAGLGFSVRPGLIYAGLAGATRWPSGKPSTNTLWGRITRMHLGGNHEYSTFRRSLGSILAHASGATTIDEAALTAWMYRHLRVVTLPYDDRDALGDVESELLTSLDPPLNLSKVPRTELRDHLKELRRDFSR